MAFVHVIDLRSTSKGMEKSDPAETEDGFLTKAIVGVAAVEVVGELAIPGVVAFDVSCRAGRPE